MPETPVAERAIDDLAATAEYFRELDWKEMTADLMSYVKAHPAQSLIGAAAIGFLAAAILRRR